MKQITFPGNLIGNCMAWNVNWTPFKITVSSRSSGLVKHSELVYDSTSLQRDRLRPNDTFRAGASIAQSSTPRITSEIAERERKLTVKGDQR
ncbi:hypothetical protein [Prescottella equi]